MNIGNLKQVATKGAGRALLVSKKFSPEILTGVGIVGVVASAVLASRSTLKLESVVDKMKEGLDTAKELKELANEGNGEYSDKEFTKDKAEVYVKGSFEIVKLYAPAVTLGVVSIGCILGGHGILKKRNVALAAAYKAIEGSYSEYRKRVIEELGEDKDRDFRLGLKDEQVRDEETGKVTTVTHVNPSGMSQYARFFDEGNGNWSKEDNYNLMFLRAQQNFANDLLLARGHVFLNDVYDMLGFDRTSAGSVVGCVVSKDGDNFIDFNIYDFQSDPKRKFVNGDERSILLDFNVDGVIYDKI